MKKKRPRNVHIFRLHSIRFRYFLSFQSRFSGNTVDLIGIRTRNMIREGVWADDKSTTTTNSFQNIFTLNQSMILSDWTRTDSSLKNKERHSIPLIFGDI